MLARILVEHFGNDDGLTLAALLQSVVEDRMAREPAPAESVATGADR